MSTIIFLIENIEFILVLIYKLIYVYIKKKKNKVDSILLCFFFVQEKIFWQNVKAFKGDISSPLL